MCSSDLRTNVCTRCPQEDGAGRFFILEWKELQNLLVRAYTEYLSKYNFVRPRVPGSFHTALAISDVEPFENEWRKILERVPSAPEVSLGDPISAAHI